MKDEIMNGNKLLKDKFNEAIISVFQGKDGEYAYIVGILAIASLMATFSYAVTGNSNKDASIDIINVICKNAKKILTEVINSKKDGLH